MCAAEASQAASSSTTPTPSTPTATTTSSMAAARSPAGNGTEAIITLEPINSSVINPKSDILESILLNESERSSILEQIRSELSYGKEQINALNTKSLHELDKKSLEQFNLFCSEEKLTSLQHNFNLSKFKLFIKGLCAITNPEEVAFSTTSTEGGFWGIGSTTKIINHKIQLPIAKLMNGIVQNLETLLNTIQKAKHDALEIRRRNGVDLQTVKAQADTEIAKAKAIAEAEAARARKAELEKARTAVEAEKSKKDSSDLVAMMRQQMEESRLDRQTHQQQMELARKDREEDRQKIERLAVQAEEAHKLAAESYGKGEAAGKEMIIGNFQSALVPFVRTQELALLLECGRTGKIPTGLTLQLTFQGGEQSSRNTAAPTGVKPKTSSTIQPAYDVDDEKRLAQEAIGQPKFGLVEKLVDLYNKKNEEKKAGNILPTESKDLDKYLRLIRFIIFQLMSHKYDKTIIEIITNIDRILTEKAGYSVKIRREKYSDLSSIITSYLQDPLCTAENLTKDSLSKEEIDSYLKLISKQHGQGLYLPEDNSATNYFSTLKVSQFGGGWDGIIRLDEVGYVQNFLERFGTAPGFSLGVTGRPPAAAPTAGAATPKP